MDYEKKNKDAIRAIKQALRLLATNGIPVGNMIKAIKDIEEKYAESEDERVRRDMIETIKKEAHDYPSSVIAEKSNSWIAYLEKQGEQKPVIDMITPEESLGISSEEYNKIVDECVYGEQKPADKVEPKFKVGNWYQCTKDFFGKGVTFDKNTAYYCAKEGCLQYEYGCHIAIVKDLYDNFKLWTIQDAKDGDVLVDEDNNIGIYRGEKDDLYWNSRIYLGCDNRLRGFSIGGRHKHENTKPATKEQRDQLEKAMADAGYTFDFEKKEPKKIEPKLADTEKGAKGNEREIPNSAWSEEDECMLNNVIDTLKPLSQTTHSGYAINSMINWLKSLRPNHWKPSDKHMKALEHFVRSIGESGYASPYDNNTKLLYSLLSDLKKLKEE